MTETTPPDPPVLSDGDCDRLWRMLLERAAERTSAAEGKLAEVRETVTTFLGHYGNSESASFKVALDLAHGIQQVLDRKPLERSEEDTRDE